MGSRNKVAVGDPAAGSPPFYGEIKKQDAYFVYELFILIILFNFERSCSKLCGDIAQLGEHLPCTQGVKGSNPFISTTYGSIAQLVRAHA